MSLGSWFELWCVIYTNNKNLIKISHVIINYALVERASKLSRFSMSLGNRLSRLQCLYRFELWYVIYTNNKNLIKISHVIINYALVERASKLSRFSMSLGNRLSRLQCL